MSVHVSSLVWKFQGLSPKEKLVLLKLADTANDEGESAYPAVSTIERESGLSESSVHRAIKSLKDHGLLLPEGRHNKRLTVIYRIDLETLRRGVTVTGVSEGQGCQADTPTGVTVTPNPSFNRPDSPLTPLYSEQADEAAALKADFDAVFPAGFWRMEPLRVSNPAMRERAALFAQRADALVVKGETAATAAIVAPMIAQCWATRLQPQDIDAMAHTWALALQKYPEWAVQEAVSQWLGENSKRRKPVVGELSLRCEKLFSVVQLIRMRCEAVKNAPFFPQGRDEEPESEKLTVAEILAEARRKLEEGGPVTNNQQGRG